MTGKPAGVCCYSVPLGVWETGKAVFPGVGEAEKGALTHSRWVFRGWSGAFGRGNGESRENLTTKKP